MWLQLYGESVFGGSINSNLLSAWDQTQLLIVHEQDQVCWRSIELM